jgi:hypothetical protein
MTEVLNTRLGAVIVRLINEANKAIPGKDGREKEKWVADQIEGVAEHTDTMIPLIGRFMDVPEFEKLANPIRRVVIEATVHRIYSYALINKLIKPEEKGADIDEDLNKELKKATGADDGDKDADTQPRSGRVDNSKDDQKVAKTQEKTQAKESKSGDSQDTQSKADQGDQKRAADDDSDPAAETEERLKRIRENLQKSDKKDEKKEDPKKD